MPTGYTHKVADGEITTLNEFAMLCSRAMGFCYSLREEPLTSSLPEKFEERPYYKNQLEETEKEYNKYINMNPEEIKTEFESYIKEETKDYEDRVLKMNDTKNNYNNMLKLVNNWNCPDDIKGLKEFMLEQLNSSIKFDVHDVYNNHQNKSMNKWYHNKLDNLKENLEYYKEQWDKEVKRTKENNRLLNLLRESLNINGIS